MDTNLNLFQDSEEDKKNKKPNKNKPKQQQHAQQGHQQQQQQSKNNVNNQNQQKERKHAKYDPNMVYPTKKERKKKRLGYNNTEEEIKDNNATLNPPFETLKTFFVKLFNTEEHNFSEMTLNSFIAKEYEGFTNNHSENIQHYEGEDDEGNTEYKLKLVNLTQDKLERRSCQMKFRLQEGGGEAKYMIGLEDDGTPTGLKEEEMHESLKTLCRMASSLKADIIIMNMRKGFNGKIAEVLVRKNQKEGIKLDIKIILLGDNQAGKSTLIGVLTSGRYDNGSGSARMCVSMNKHEVLTGQTSSVSHHILGFDSQGNITNHSDLGNPSWEQIVDSSTKILTFIDIGGHEKYTKKIITGLCSLFPDYSIVVVSAKQGVTKVTEQHFMFASIFEVPIIIVLTCCDMVTESRIDQVAGQIRDVLEEKILLIVKDEKDLVLMSKNLKEQIAPLFKVSNVTGYGLDLFKNFLNLLPVNNPLSNNVDMHSEFFIHTIFMINNAIILGGTVIKGKISVKQILNLGPDQKGNFRNVTVEGIQCKKVPVTYAICGQSCTVRITPGKFCQQWLETNKEGIRRGMILVDLKSKPKAALGFIAEIGIYENRDSPTRVWECHEPVVTSQTTHQVCSILFDTINPDDIKEADLSKPRTFTENLSNNKLSLGKKKNSEDNSPKELILPGLIRQKSKSQDDKLNIRLFKEKNSSETESPDQTIDFSKRKIGNMCSSSISNPPPNTNNTITDNGNLDQEHETLEIATNTYTKISKMRKSTKSLIEETKTNYSISMNTIIDKPKKMTSQEKIPNFKKDSYPEDSQSRKKRIIKYIKYITLEQNKTKTLKFMFKYHPEYITKGQKIIINDSSMRAIGTVKEIIYVTASS